MHAIYKAVVETDDDIFSALENYDRSISIYMNTEREPVVTLQPSWPLDGHAPHDLLMAELVSFVYEMHRGYEIKKAIFVLVR